MRQALQGRKLASRGELVSRESRRADCVGVRVLPDTITVGLFLLVCAV